MTYNVFGGTLNLAPSISGMEAERRCANNEFQTVSAD